MRDKIDRTGEKGINNFGSEMVIINSYMEFNSKYKRNYTYIDVYFSEYDYIVKKRKYSDFKKGAIKCPYDKSICGIGYIGEGKYRIKENGKFTREYNTWRSMLQRCYSKKFHEKHPTYIDCESSKEFLNFQKFGKWDKDNYYEVEGEGMELDKDILVKHNKIYSPDTCIYVPKTINTLFTKNDKDRGESVIGTTPHHGKYQVKCNMVNPKTGKSKNEYLGIYETEIEAFEVYKYYKERNIKQVADYFEKHIPENLYYALYNYEVEITD
jgi:hypothetical protein